MTSLLLFLALLLWPDAALAQSLNINLGDGEGSAATTIVQMIGLVTLLSIAPGLLVMVTSFTRIVVVLSFLRNALGTQQTPPNVVMISLAMFLTFFIMAPVLERAYNDGLRPYMENSIEAGDAFERTAAPFREFMLAQTRQKDLELFVELSRMEPPATPDAIPLHVIIPSFIISELRRAFEIGFLLFLPFLVLDLVIATILMSMGMMMLPPVVISMPFKIIFFVLVDGWNLVAGSLVQSFVALPPPAGG